MAGFSLPSGHSMMSAIVLLFLCLKIKEPWVIAFAVLFESLVFVNVIFLGTHTVLDVIVGWTAAALMVALFMLLERRLHPYFTHRTEPSTHEYPSSPIPIPYASSHHMI